MREMLTAMNIAYEQLDAEVLDIVFEGDRFAGIRTVCARHRGTGVVTRTHICDWVRFEDGPIVEIVEFMDTMPLGEFCGFARA